MIINDIYNKAGKEKLISLLIDPENYSNLKLKDIIKDYRYQFNY